MDRAWEVKKVLDKRVNPQTGDLEYLLEWKDWDGPPTWEPLINCDCTALIRRYERQSQTRHPQTRHPQSRHPPSRQHPPTRSSSRTRAPPPSPPPPRYPRAKTPPKVEVCCDSSCSEAGSVAGQDRDWDCEIKRRKLLLKEIVGAVNGEEILLIVKWHGIANLEKVPLQVLRRFHSQDILDFLLAKISWTNSTDQYQPPA